MISFFDRDRAYMGLVLTDCLPQIPFFFSDFARIAEKGRMVGCFAGPFGGIYVSLVLPAWRRLSMLS